MKNLKDYFFLIFSILISCLLFVIFTKSRIEEAKTITQMVKENKEKLVVLTKKADFLSSLDEGKLDDQVTKINFVLPSEKNIDNLMFSLERIAKEASVSINNLSFSPGLVSTQSSSKNLSSLGKNNLETFDIKSIIEGTSADLKIFFEKLKNSLLATEIKKVDISFPETKEGKVTATLIFGVYYKPVSLILEDIFKPLTILSKEENTLLSEVGNLSIPSEIIFPTEIPTRTRVSPF